MLATPHIAYVTENLYRTFYGDAVTSITTWLGKRAEGKANLAAESGQSASVAGTHA